MKKIISIIEPTALEMMYELRIETVDSDGYKTVKEKEFMSAKSLLVELKKILK